MVIHEVAEHLRSTDMQLHEVVDKDKQPLSLNGIPQRYYGRLYAIICADSANKMFPERAPFTIQEVPE